MKQAGIFCLLELTTTIGILLGIYLIVGSVTMGYIVLVPDFTKRLDKLGLRSPQLVNLVIHGSYLVPRNGLPHSRCFSDSDYRWSLNLDPQRTLLVEHLSVRNAIL